MQTEIVDGKELWIDGKCVYKTEGKIFKVIQLREEKVIVHIRAEENDLFCLDKHGKLLWNAESVSPHKYATYIDFSVERDGFVYGHAQQPGYGRLCKIDPNTGKILEDTLNK